jgi:hypothetical protein
MSSTARYTTISLRPDTVRQLQLYKTGGKTWDDVLEEFMDNFAPEEFVRWAAAELKRPGISAEEFRRRHGLK